MISNRLFSKLVIGKEYLITTGIYYCVLEVMEDLIWCRDLDNPSSFFAIYRKDWDDFLFESRDDSNFYHRIKYRYNKENPTYRFEASISKMFVGGRIDFSLYDLFFLGEYTKDRDMEEVKRFCNLFGITYKWESKKERRRILYKSKL